MQPNDVYTNPAPADQPYQPVVSQAPPLRPERKGSVWSKLLIVLLIILAAGGAYYYQQGKVTDLKNQLNDQKKTDTQLSAQLAEKNNAQLAEKAGTPLTMDLATSDSANLKTTLNLTTPAGWTKIDGSHIEKTIDGQKYDMTFQLNDKDYLKLPAYVSKNIVSVTKTADGQSAYLLNSNDNIALSSCAPVKNAGCSFAVPDKNIPSKYSLFLLLVTPGGQAPGVLDFSKASTFTAIADMTSIVGSINLK